MSLGLRKLLLRWAPKDLRDARLPMMGVPTGEVDTGCAATALFVVLRVILGTNLAMTPVSTGFVESAINTVVGKRFGKRQQMRWSKPGAHLMLQTRTRALDGTLREKFEQWYPGLKNDDAPGKAEQLAA